MCVFVYVHRYRYSYAYTTLRQSSSMLTFIVGLPEVFRPNIINVILIQRGETKIQYYTVGQLSYPLFSN